MDERGSGLLSSVLGVGIVMVLVGFAVNVSLGLWIRSTVDAVAYDTARDVATAPVGADRDGARRAAVERARAALGSYGSRVRFDFEGPLDGGQVVLHVQAPGVSLLPRLLGGGPVVGSIDRRVVIAAESP